MKLFNVFEKIVAYRLRIAANTQTPSFDDEDESDEEFEETPEERGKLFNNLFRLELVLVPNVALALKNLKYLNI